MQNNCVCHLSCLVSTAEVMVCLGPGFIQWTDEICVSSIQFIHSIPATPLCCMARALCAIAACKRNKRMQASASWGWRQAFQDAWCGVSHMQACYEGLPSQFQEAN